MKSWLKIALVAALPVMGHAHTASPYVLPEVFDTTSSNVTFQSAITIEKFFVASNNFKTNYVITNPKGQKTDVSPAASLKRFSIAEFDLTDEGTYRIQTKDAVGTPGKYALVDGRWLRVRPARPANAPAMPAPQATATAAATAPKAATPAAPAQPPRVIAADQVPANAQILEVSNYYVAESYVTKGKPTDIPAVTNKGFELKLNQHPNNVYAGDKFKGVALINGKPIADLEVDIFKGASSYQANAKREQPHVTTNAKGEFEIEFKDAGIYLITASYPEANPDNTKKPSAENYTYSLTLEVNE